MEPRETRVQEVVDLVRIPDFGVYHLSGGPLTCPLGFDHWEVEPYAPNHHPPASVVWDVCRSSLPRGSRGKDRQKSYTEGETSVTGSRSTMNPGIGAPTVIVDTAPHGGAS